MLIYTNLNDYFMLILLVVWDCDIELMNANYLIYTARAFMNFHNTSFADIKTILPIIRFSSLIIKKITCHFVLKS